MKPKQFKIAFVGPSGVGKSTAYVFAASYLRDNGYDVWSCNVALPLRKIQKYAYTTFYLRNPGDPCEFDFRQDGKLLAFLANHFEKQLPDDFKRRFQSIVAYKFSHLAIINTDCRNNMYPTLKKLGFIFVRIFAESEILAWRRKERDDLTNYDLGATVEQTNTIEVLRTIQNNGTKKELRNSIELLIQKLLGGNKA